MNNKPRKTGKKNVKKKALFVPKEYGGQWIAWNHSGTAIVGHGKTLEEAVVQATTAGEADPGFEWVPPFDRSIIGGN